MASIRSCNGDDRFSCGCNGIQFRRPRSAWTAATGNDAHSIATLPPSRASSIAPGRGIDKLDQSRFGGSLVFDVAACHGCVEVVVGMARGDA